ncbi:MAG: TonB-dependent receptor, partial [Bacteroidota bacterium]
MKQFLLLAIIILPLVLKSQNVEVKGVIRDVAGDPLAFTSIVILPDSLVASSDMQGSYSARISTGSKKLIVSYIGFESAICIIEICKDTILDFILTPKTVQLEEVVIAGDRFSNEDIVQSVASGTHFLTQKDVLQMPALMGEANLLKAIRLLPGTVGGIEGSSDSFVRGGAADQNLVLLDGAPIYNTGHLFGFLSVFNPDIVDQVDVINGGFPAAFGGRLSSILNISSLSLIPEKTSLSADVGLITSRVKLEQPILKDKASFWMAGRQSYIDKIAKHIFDKKIPYSFYDVNGKLILHPTKSDQMEISHYEGEDFLDFLNDSDGDGNGMHTTYHSTNTSQTFKWLHRTLNKWRKELSMFHTYFDYRTKNAYNKDYLVSAHSEIEDYGAKFSIEKDSVWKDALVSAGVEWIRHGISPKVLNSEGSIADIVESGSTTGKIAQEFAAYIQQEWSVTKTLKINAGLRGSMAVVSAREYFFPEPRISARYALGKNGALKFNYSRMVQYVHRISNSAVSTPIDVWFPVTGKVRPQASHQFALAWQRFIPAEKIYCNVEGYYKFMEDLVAYKEGTNFLFQSDFDSRLIQGRGNAYGLEFLIRKDAGKFTGWISYTLSWSRRKYDELNNGRWFNARYDRRHNGAIVAQHLIKKRWAASMVWEYISGARFTPVVG